jgi:Uma2 family endonuclease
MSRTLLEARSVVPLRGVSFDVYNELRREPANRLLRMTYHNGTLEIMSPQYRHEKASRRIGFIVLAVTSVLGIPCQGAGSTTFSRRGPRRLQGWRKEPDQSFYLANEPRIRGKEEIDLETDSPPDLWIEVDHRGSSRGRLPLYASLGIPEIWRFGTRSRRLCFGRLEGSTYHEIDRSFALPMLTPALVLVALDLGADRSESEWDFVLRTWVRERFSPREPGRLDG